MNETPSARYWRRTRLLTFFLSTVWAVLTFGVVFFARQISGLTLFGWPLSFYMAAQGLVFAYLILIGIYVLGMQKLDRLHNTEQQHGA
jgi:putative solute:sodium symporter small subunit